MKLHELAPPKGARTERRRVGRGLGSGRGKTAGKGTKGQKARSGGGVPPYFEGGQLPLVRRLPYRRGFNNPFKIQFEIVNLDQFEALDAGSTVNVDALAQRGVIRKSDKPLKILGRGSLTKKLTVQAHAFSRPAEEAIQKAGGKIERVPHAAIKVQEKPAAPAEEAPRARARARAAARAAEEAPQEAPEEAPDKTIEESAEKPAADAEETQA